MVSSTSRQGSLFYVAFAREASLIKDDLLEPIDTLLEDEALVASVRVALGKRSAKSNKTGRPGIAPDRRLRLLVLKQNKGWSWRELEREVRSSLIGMQPGISCKLSSSRLQILTATRPRQPFEQRPRLPP